MVPYNAFQAYNERRLALPALCRTTLTFSIQGVKLVGFSPFSTLTLQESLLRIWGEMRTSPVPELEAFFRLFTEHPRCWDMWGVVARKFLKSFDGAGEYFCDVIGDAQMILHRKLGDSDDLWHAAVAKEVGEFPGWVSETMLNHCRDAWYNLGRHLFGTQGLPRITDASLQEIAEPEELIGSLESEELWAIVATYPVRVAEALRLWARDHTQKEIAALMGLSEDQVFRALSEGRKRLREDSAALF